MSAEYMTESEQHEDFPLWVEFEAPEPPKPVLPSFEEVLPALLAAAHTTPVALDFFPQEDGSGWQEVSRGVHVDGGHINVLITMKFTVNASLHARFVAGLERIASEGHSPEVACRRANAEIRAYTHQRVLEGAAGTALSLAMDQAVSTLDPVTGRKFSERLRVSLRGTSVAEKGYFTLTDAQQAVARVQARVSLPTRSTRRLRWFR